MRDTDQNGYDTTAGMDVFFDHRSPSKLDHSERTSRAIERANFIDTMGSSLNRYKPSSADKDAWKKMMTILIRDMSPDLFRAFEKAVDSLLAFTCDSKRPTGEVDVAAIPFTFPNFLSNLIDRSNNPRTQWTPLLRDQMDLLGLLIQSKTQAQAAVSEIQE